MKGRRANMIERMPTHCGDETCPSCVIAGDYIFLAHHAGGFDRLDMAHQVRVTLERIRQTLDSVGATLDDMVQMNFYIRNVADFDAGRNVIAEYFPNGAPARMTVVTQFLDDACLCQIDGIVYKPR